MRVSEYRIKIDALDCQLVALLAQREQLVRLIHADKSHAQEPLYSPEREQEVLCHVRRLANQFGLSEMWIAEIYLKIVRYFVEPTQGDSFRNLETGMPVGHHAKHS
jgi:chorismate mutase